MDFRLVALLSILSLKVVSDVRLTAGIRKMDLNNKVVVFCLTIMMLLSLHMTDGHGSGPPVNSVTSLCRDMTPRHGGSSQSSAAPYTITASPTCYTPGQAVTVNLSANTGTFQGFFMQARKPNDNTMSYGTFDVTGNTLSQTLDCFGQTNNAVGHNSKSDKSSMGFQWTPPSDLTGDAEFVTSVAQTKEMYWVASVKKTIRQCDSSVSTTPTNVAGRQRAEMFIVNSLLLLVLLTVMKIVDRD